MTVSCDKLVPLGELARAFGYSRDHLAYLCRTGEIIGARAGRSWQTTSAAVARYKEATEAREEQRWEEMSNRQKRDPNIQITSELSEYSDRLYYSLSHSLAHAVQKPGPWVILISGGLDVAIESHKTAIRLVFGLPARAAMFSLHRALRSVYFVFNAPIGSIDGMKRGLVYYYRISRKPIHELYGAAESHISLHRFVRGAQRTRGAIQFVLAILVIAAWMPLVSNTAQQLTL